MKLLKTLLLSVFATLSAVAQTAVTRTSAGVVQYTGLTIPAPLVSTSIRPATDDGAPLGDTTHNWSDLFMATGGVINFANGNWVATHSSGILTVGTGDFRITTAGTNAASAVTVGGTQTLTSKTLTSPTMTAPVLGTIASGVGTSLTALTAANISAGALANGMTATTQAVADNSTKLATTAFVLANAGGSNAITAASAASGAGVIWQSAGADRTAVASNTLGTVGITTASVTNFTYGAVTFTGVTGTGKVVADTSPTLVTPVLGVAAATSVNKWVLTAPSTAATLTAGGDSLTYTFPASTQTIPGLTDAVTFTNKKTDFGSSLGTDDTFVGEVISGLNNSGGVTQWDAVYLNSSSQWVKADANGSGTYPAVGIATATSSTGNPTTVLVRGVFRDDGGTSWTVGGNLYLSTTAGGLTSTPPTTTGDKIQVIGTALAAHTVYVHPGTDYGTAP